MVTMALLPFPRARSVPPAAARLAAHAITLRPATNDDLPLLAHLYAGFRNTEMLLVPWSASEKQAFFDDQFRLQHSHLVRHFRRADFWIVCDADSAPLGRFYLDRSAREWRLVDILLAPAARCRGIGTALVRWAQAYAADTGASGIALHVAINNPRAYALYTRMGFVEGASQDGLHVPMRWCTGET
jgi:ribosomal protein S18 acetylase RimI-like enzyme